MKISPKHDFGGRLLYHLKALGFKAFIDDDCIVLVLPFPDKPEMKIWKGDPFWRFQIESDENGLLCDETLMNDINPEDFDAVLLEITRLYKYYCRHEW